MGFGKASNMSYVTWNIELAKLAELNVKTCIFAHDKCRNTLDYPYAGQNIAIMSGFFTNITETIEKLIDLWWDEYKKTNNEALHYLTEM